MDRGVLGNQRALRCSASVGSLATLMLLSVSGCAETGPYRDMRPSCKAPARLQGHFDSRAPGFVIELRPTADASSVADDLATRYGFPVRPLYPADSLIITTGSMTPRAVAALRCDPAVETISHEVILKHVI
jgi:hypothetical protein